jgi:diguanylate cyclase
MSDLSHLHHLHHPRSPAQPQDAAQGLHGRWCETMPAPDDLAAHEAAPHAFGSGASSASDKPAEKARQALMTDLTVLMIDDEPMLTDVIQAYLEDAGYHKLVAVNDPTQAMEVARRCKPSLVLLDLMMPRVSGFEILEALRHDEELRYVPVIVLTAASDPATKLRALDLGATEFLAKPVDQSELVLRVRNSLVLKVYQDRLANSDPLTGLPNRRVFIDRLHASVAHAVLAQHPMALLHVGLDRFRHVGATLGHASADHLLSRVARRLKGCVRRYEDDVREDSNPGRVESVLISRLDSDAFAVLLPRTENPEDAARVARRVLQTLSRPFRIGADDLVITPQVGIAVLPDDGTNADTLMANALAAAEHAAAGGRSGYRFYCPEFNQAAIERLKLEAHLRRALDRNEMRVVYQPKVDRVSGRINGAEALLRWRQSELGNIGPDRFIPIAEETGLIVELGAWVIEQACAQLAQWQRQGLAQMKVALNLSRQELVSGALVSNITQALRKHALPRGSLVLELTESVLIDRLDSTSAQLDELRRLGVEISIDDFGTGYSSMNYIKHFPLDELKIDRSFVMGLPEEKTDLAIVRAMVVLGHSLGMRVVAEGIETAEQLAVLSSLGIDQYQGYLFGRPLPPTDFAALAQRFDLRGALAG